MDPLSDPAPKVGPAAIERGVTYLIVGMGITLFFLLAVFGMGRVEKLSADATREQRTNPAETSDIVGSDQR